MQQLITTAQSAILSALLTVALTTAAFAHSKVSTTTPAHGATLADVPAEIGLAFAKDIRLTKVEMRHQDDPSVALDLGDQTRFGRTFTLPLQEMGGGAYHIEWRGLGKDGHAMQGAFTFTVD